MKKQENLAENLAVVTAQQIKDSMALREKIKLMNTPYFSLPDNLKIGMVKRPQKFNFVKMSKPNIGEQRETFAARLIRARMYYHLSIDMLASIANDYARKYGTQVTRSDIYKYENYNVCPKIDKMTAISEAIGLPLDYFAGYGPVTRRGRNQILEARRNMKP